MSSPEQGCHSEETASKFPADEKSNVEPFFRKAVGGVILKKGEMIKFGIPFGGEPQPTIQWFHEKNELVTGGRFHIICYGNFAVLIVKDVVRSDTGIYTVTLTNCCGAISSSGSVVVLGKPSVPCGPLKCDKISEDCVKLSWMRPEDIGGQALKYYKIEKLDVTSGQWVLVSAVSPFKETFEVKGLKSMEDNIFCVKAVNKDGESEPLYSEENIEAKYLCDTRENILKQKQRVEIYACKDPRSRLYSLNLKTDPADLKLPDFRHAQTYCINAFEYLHNPVIARFVRQEMELSIPRRGPVFEISEIEDISISYSTSKKQETIKDGISLNRQCSVVLKQDEIQSYLDLHPNMKLALKGNNLKKRKQEDSPNSSGKKSIMKKQKQSRSAELCLQKKREISPNSSGKKSIMKKQKQSRSAELGQEKEKGYMKDGIFIMWQYSVVLRRDEIQRYLDLHPNVKQV